MKKRKTIKKLEALIDALENSKEICSHNEVETRYIQNKIYHYQRKYNILTGHFYKGK